MIRLHSHTRRGERKTEGQKNGGQLDRRGNLEIMKQNEHDIHYIHTTMNNGDCILKPGLNSCEVQKGNHFLSLKRHPQH